VTTLLRARLYTRLGCHLCEEARRDLEALRARLPHELQLVDISDDPDLVQRYGERIPVLEVAGREYAAPLPRAVLERALRQAAER
jgi:hypothetical protein